MLGAESLTVINNRLRDRFGRIENGMPRWRVSWSTGEIEKIWVDEVAGIHLSEPQVREMIKYPLHQDFYILERVVPTAGNQTLVEPFSYEPIWVFRDKDDKPLPPKWEAIEFLIYRIHEQMLGHEPRYKDKNETDEEREEKVKRVYEALYGNETEVGNRLALGEGVGYSGEARKVN